MRKPIVGFASALSAFSMWSFILPLRQSRVAAGIVSSALSTAFVPESTALTVPGTEDWTRVSNVVVVQVKSRTLELPSIHSLLCGWRTSGSPGEGAAMAAGAREITGRGVGGGLRTVIS